MPFDIFTIRQYRECYILQVGIARPPNAPRYRHTKADRNRMLTANATNRELLERQFATLDEVVEEIKRLQFPQAEQAVAAQAEETVRRRSQGAKDGWEIRRAKQGKI